ncbi:MAG: hypothetical protein HYY23_09955 [Verrucomicrobia bacterium]|nr:hypothetical protein [Verrucomicrobiota bacterium]
MQLGLKSRTTTWTICGPAFLNLLQLAGLALTLHTLSLNAAQSARSLKAGASAIDITPAQFPVLVNGGFLEARATKANDALHARALVLDDGTNRIAIAVVDSCMLPRDLIDDAKRMAHEQTGIAVERMLVSATHTHSAPAAMGCLGASADLQYAKALPSKIAQAIALAAKNLAPARIGWAVVDDFEHTHNRRWIYRPDKIKTDPFGGKTVRANMHPGYENPDAIGPSGPVDPGLSVVAIQSIQGKPIALLANYSMHYFGATPVSADYYGRFADKIKNLIGAQAVDPPFVGIMSQGTSGDQMWMDYGKPRQNLSLAEYADGVARSAFAAYQKIRFHDWAPVAMAESKLTLRRRTPNEKRLSWARQIVAKMEGRKPTNQIEVYAREQIFLHQDPIRELKLQAVRIGGLGIAAIPNEVFAITGLKIKALSPLAPTFTIELANGAEGYIPPPAQHALGGYTTWPARTAALEVEAEPKITEAILKLLEEASGQRRRNQAERHGSYAEAVLASKPIAYWRLSEFHGPTAFDSSGRNNHATYEDGTATTSEQTPASGIAYYLEGPSSAAVMGFATINHAVHLAGGRIRASLKGLRNRYSVEMWFWNGLPTNARATTGCLFTRRSLESSGTVSDRLEIAGTAQRGKLVFCANNGLADLIAHGRASETPLKTWNHVVFVRDGRQIKIFLNGNPEPEISARLKGFSGPKGGEFFFGGAAKPDETFEGKLDEVAVFNRALTAREIARHFQSVTSSK